jgi:hypothetical protein
VKEWLIILVRFSMALRSKKTPHPKDRKKINGSITGVPHILFIIFEGIK